MFITICNGIIRILFIITSSYKKIAIANDNQQLIRIQKDILRLPVAENIVGFNACQEKINKVCSIMEDINPETILEVNPETSEREHMEKTLSELSDLLHETSLAISNTYFDHTYQQKQMVNQKIES